MVTKCWGGTGIFLVLYPFKVHSPSLSSFIWQYHCHRGIVPRVLQNEKYKRRLSLCTFCHREYFSIVHTVHRQNLKMSYLISEKRGKWHDFRSMLKWMGCCFFERREESFSCCWLRWWRMHNVVYLGYFTMTYDGFVLLAHLRNHCSYRCSSSCWINQSETSSLVCENVFV